MKKRGLGRGLGMLLNQTTALEDIEAKQEQILSLKLEQLRPGQFQPRKRFNEEALDALAESLRTQGVLQPLVVRPLEAGLYEILAGERRFRAAKKAGLKRVPVLVRKISDKEALAIALVENIQRENLNPIETAIALERLIKEFSLTHEEAGKLLGKSRSTISNALRLLLLSPVVQDYLVEETMEMGHGRALLSLKKEVQEELALLVVKEKLTVRETEKLVKEYLQSPQEIKVHAHSRLAKSGQSKIIKTYEEKLASYFGLKTKIKEEDKNKGLIMIRYENRDELDQMLTKLTQEAT